MDKVYNPFDVANRLREMADLRRVAMQEVLLDCGMNKNAMTHMRKSMPSAGSLAKLADRLECSVDYLLGRTTDMLTPGADQTPPPIQETDGRQEDVPQLSRNTAEMLELFKQLPAREQILFIGRLQEAVVRTVGEGENSGSSPVKAG